ELGAADLQMPTIGIKHLPNDGQPEPSTGATLIEPSAALEDAGDLIFRNAVAIVVDGNPERREGRGDLDLRSRMMRGILENVAEHLGQVGAIERQPRAGRH